MALASNVAKVLLRGRPALRHFGHGPRLQPISTPKNIRLNRTLASAVAATIAAALLLHNSYSLKNETRVDMTKPPITPEEVAKHNTGDDCWVVIDGYVYDLTDFLPSHPGGIEPIKYNAGKDVSAIFDPLHPPDSIEKNIPADKRLGPLAGDMPADKVCAAYTPGESPDEIAEKIRLRNLLPPLNTLTNLYDFEFLASQTLTKQAWAYYSSAADDEITYRENHGAYHRIFFRPKVLVDVSKVDISTDMIGEHSDVPFYVSATALAKLGNQAEGEKDITRGCGQGPKRAPQMISTLSSCSLDEIVGAKVSKDQTLWFQLYVNSNRKVTRDLVKHAEDLGIKALFVTVDAPSLGSREKDAKLKFAGGLTGPRVMDKDTRKGDKANGASRALSKFIDPSLTWDDIESLKSQTKMPIILKGVQRAEDVIKAAKIGCYGVVLSNHGGRQLDFSRAPIEVLAECMPELKKQGLDKDFEVYIDGGIRRGTDILKALCLGAKGVGLGRPFLYANSCYGKDGVQRAIDMLASELEMNMRLLGVRSISELTPELLDLSALKARTHSVPRDYLYKDVYKPPQLAQFLDSPR